MLPGSFYLSSSFNSFPGGSDSKASAYNAGDLGSVPGSGRSPAEGNDNLLQYSRLENPVGGGAWWAAVHRVAESWAQPRDITFEFVKYIIFKMLKMPIIPV